MLTRVTKNTAHFCARLFICLQLLLPSALSYAAPSHMDLSSFMCSPSGQPLSPSAQQTLKDLAELLGEHRDDTEVPSDHCDMCILSTLALASVDLSFCGQSLGQHVPIYPAFEIGLVHKVHGPPTGSRAPPTFI